MTVRVRIRWGRRSALRIVADLLILAGVAGIGFWAWALADGALYQYVQSAYLARSLEEGPHGPEMAAEPAGDPPPETMSLRREEPPKLVPSLTAAWRPDPLVVGRLEVPSIGLSVILREGVDETTLRKAVGHLPSSAGPGEVGNFVLLGHRDTFFRPLRNIARGDRMRVETRTGRFTYIVESITARSPNALPVASTGEEAISTLITCYPFSFTGPAPRRFVVQARLIDPDESDSTVASAR